MRDYEIISIGNEEISGRPTVHLRLTARPNGKAYYPRIDLWVDKEIWVPVQQEFVEPNRSITTLLFEELRINDEVKDSLFNVKLPAGVERVKG
jgi:outer membrane lipoprotein-sorting protein